MPFARRLSGLDVSPIRRLFELAGPDAVHLGIGEPHVQPAPHVVDAYAKALRDGRNKYGPTAGLPELREALASRAGKARPGTSVDDVLVTSGSTQALFGAFFCLVDDGDEVLVPDPGFVLYAPHTRLAGGRAVPYTLDDEHGFQPDPDQINERITARTRILVVNSPSNPTGSTIGREALRALVDIAEDRGLFIVTDEAYDAITYGAPHESLLGASERVIYMNSFSKTYAMTGWRLGYAVAPTEVARKMRAFLYHVSACPSTPTQLAALAALEGPQASVTRMVQELAQRRDAMVRRIRANGRFSLVEPRGAFYAFPRYDMDTPSEELCRRLLDGGVVTVPGSAFGAAGEGHVRLSFATSLETIEKGMDRIEAVLDAS